jgi:hypothetical protein
MSNSENKGQVVSLSSFRKKQEINDELARGRKPLFVSHMSGKVSGSPHLKDAQDADFGDRMQRIRTSLDRINRLMSELKQMAAEQKAAAEVSSKS